ncbi:hypothetical protein FQR65_LT17254 [Abscondita terminalis]|nr:hypothetical protein FQR65_LT17254 [Abscondita terminalis]
MKQLPFIGDGVNDAPVVALSDVGMAMGGLGSDATIETADVVIQDDRPSKIPTAIRIGKETKKIVWQNIILAFAVKAIVLVLGAGGVATMWEAVFADVGVTLLAILNANIFNIKKMKNQSQTLFQKDLVNEAVKQSFVKLNPKIMFKNPVMFLVEIGTGIFMFIVSLFSLAGNTSQGSFAYNFSVFIILFFTVLFANFAEAIAEARGKAQADSLRKTREETPAKVIIKDQPGFQIETTLKRSAEINGDIFLFEAARSIPGWQLLRIATIDESAITGESAPVIRSGGRPKLLTGVQKYYLNRIKVKVTTKPGEIFLDKMIALVEELPQKTPNEIAN